MFINLLIISREIRQNIEKSTYLPSCAHSLKSTSRFDLGYGDSEEEALLRAIEAKINERRKEEEEIAKAKEKEEFTDVWMEIYENSLNCNYYNCYCE